MDVLVCPVCHSRTLRLIQLPELVMWILESSHLRLKQLALTWMLLLLSFAQVLMPLPI